MSPFTALPRWTLQPAPGVREHVVEVPDTLMTALPRLAQELGVSLNAILLAAHARVLAALSGEREVVIGRVAHPGRPPLPLELSTAPRTWRALLEEAHRAEQDQAARGGAAWRAAALRPETILDPTGRGGELDEHTTLRVDVLRRERIALRLRYRTDVIDPAGAARIAGYHLAALASVIADPDAAHARQSLLSLAELDLQLHGLVGPVRKLPACPAHELFEARARAHPHAIAAEHGDRTWTYAHLNARANQLARALLAHGLEREHIVAVVTERNLDWMATVLGIFKAGGAYLPIEPHFPAERIGTMLARSGCRLVVTEPGSTTTLERALEALPWVRSLRIDAVHDEGYSDHDLDVRVSPGQLAYVFFTSGSTGEPRGAMCEHAGLLNHLFAKIHDLGISEGRVVAQTAPQCFDISLWQLLAALLVGGRTLLVEQEAILDPARFVDRIARGRVAVFQVVPSYLGVLLSYLAQHPRMLPDLRCVSVTGEAVKKELVERWFAAQPAVPLVNAYGLTETSDDTHHEIMDGVPQGDRIPLGRPIHNVNAYVVDEHLSLVPLGAPGEIVFSGVCVGRGYINDPERTASAFVADPHREGQRLFRSGDHGRWRPDGKLEFLGRRDGQVKVNGFRIELGEVEDALSRLPGVRAGAVLVSGGADHNRHLVAFYAAERPLDTGALRERLAATLPAYMVPAVLQWLRALPLTANGKVDRKALAALAKGADAADAAEPAPGSPWTATERRLADAWADVLGIPGERIGPHDDFFALGGTSLAAVKLVIQLDRAIGLKDLAEHPVLSDLAAWIDHKGELAHHGSA